MPHFPLIKGAKMGAIKISKIVKIKNKNRVIAKNQQIDLNILFKILKLPSFTLIKYKNVKGKKVKREIIKNNQHTILSTKPE